MIITEKEAQEIGIPKALVDEWYLVMNTIYQNLGSLFNMHQKGMTIRTEPYTICTYFMNEKYLEVKVRTEEQGDVLSMRHHNLQLTAKTIGQYLKYAKAPTR